MSNAFAENLRGRVMDAAKIDYAQLPPDVRSFVDSTVTKWVRQRSLRNGDIERCAAEVSAKCPRLVGSKVRSRPSKSITPAPTGQSVQQAAVAKGGAAAPADAPVVARSRSVLSDAPARTVRPAVLRRLQRVSADRDWHESVAREVAEADAEKARLADEKARVRERMRQDMAQEEVYRQQRMEQERLDREQQRQMVHRAVADVARDDAIDRERRRAKFAREKADIDAQVEHRKRRAEQDRQRAQAENERLRREYEEGLKLDAQLAKQRDSEVRTTLLSYLNDSAQILAAKKEQQRQERERQAQMVAEQMAQVEADTKSRKANSDAKRTLAVKKQQLLQDCVAKQYETLAHEREARIADDEQKIYVSVQRGYDAADRRAKADQERSRSLRRDLVRSLDDEIALKHERDEAATRDKARLRRLADEEAAAVERARREQLVERKKMQLQLRAGLSRQVEAHTASLMEPTNMKL